MRFLRPLPDGLPHALSVNDGHDRGLTRSQMRNSAFIAPFHGTRLLTSEEPTLALRCAALLSRMPERIVFSHITAAQLHGMWLPLVNDRRIHAMVPAPHTRVRRRGVIGHSAVLTRADRDVVSDLPVTSVERTWCDLGSILDVPDLVAAADGLLCWKNPRTTEAKLRAAADRCKNHAWFRRLDDALALASHRSASRPESLVRVDLTVSSIPTPTANFRLNLTHAPGYRVIDLAYPKYKLGIEYHGDHHRTDKKQWRADVQRTNEIIDEGWEQLQFTGGDLGNLPDLRDRIERRLRALGWTP